MKAVAYLRVSTTEQATDGYSIAAQRRAVEGYCQAQGWELVEVYADEGRSGSSIEGRDDLKRLLADSGSGRFERVIFWKLDRLGRSLRDLRSRKSPRHRSHRPFLGARPSPEGIPSRPAI